MHLEGFEYLNDLQEIAIRYFFFFFQIILKWIFERALARISLSKYISVT